MDNKNLTVRQMVKIANKILDQLHMAGSHKRMMVRKRISDFLSRADDLRRIHERLLRCEQMKWFASSRRAMESAEILFVELDGLISDAQMAVGNVVFCCVDAIDIRRLIWQSVKDRVSFFCDGRMSAEILRILTACDAASREHYPATLFAAEEAYQGTCTAKTTIYTANIAAGLMLGQFTKYLRGLPIDPDIQLNLLSTELTVAAI